MNIDINTDFKRDIIKLMYRYVNFLKQFENDNINNIDTKFIKNIESNTFSNEKHKELIVDIAKDMLISNNKSNGITVNDNTVVDAVCRVKTNKNIPKPESINYEEADIFKFYFSDKTDMFHIKNKLMEINNNLDTVKKTRLYFELENTELKGELIVWSKNNQLKM